MFCPKCGKEMPEGIKFCTNCGLNLEAFLVKTVQQPAPAAQPEPAAPAYQQPAPAAQPEPAPQVYQQVPPAQSAPQKAPKSGFSGLTGGTGAGVKKLPVIIGAAAVLAGIILAIVLGAGRPKYKINDPELKPVTPIEGYAAADSDELELSFLYPEGSALRDNGSRGVYIYTSGSQGLPYIQITKVKGKSDPDKYFSSYKKQTEREYSGAEFEDIRKVSVTDKTLYMMRAYVFSDGADQVIDRYIEIYPKETVEYTIKSLNAKSEEMAMAAVAESLRPGTGVYGNTALYQQGSEAPSGGTAPLPGGTDGGTGAPVTETAAPAETSGSGTAMPGSGTGAPGAENYQMVTSSAGFGLMVDTTLVQSWKEINGGLDIRLKQFANDEDADITVMKNDFTGDGIHTGEQFLQAYIQEMVSEGAAAPEIYDMGGGFLQFKGITSTYTVEEDTYAMYLFAADNGKGNVYTIYFENTPEAADAYTEVVNGIFATLTDV